MPQHACGGHRTDNFRVDSLLPPCESLGFNSARFQWGALYPLNPIISLKSFRFNLHPLPLFAESGNPVCIWDVSPCHQEAQPPDKTPNYLPGLGVNYSIKSQWPKGRVWGAMSPALNSEIIESPGPPAHALWPLAWHQGLPHLLQARRAPAAMLRVLGFTSPVLDGPDSRRRPAVFTVFSPKHVTQKKKCQVVLKNV